MLRLIQIAVVVAAALAVGWYILDQRADNGADAAASGTAMVQVTEPELAADEVAGKLVFDANCAACHGPDAAGRDGIAPPLVHKIYEPSHHGDATFLLAVRNGVRSHHWRFGSMAPVQGLNDAEIDMIVAYVRALQRANGIN
jgi:mono/diheme cytochrome c family protein